MANTTFSGPIRAGNIRNTVGTTVGTDVANVGYVVMMQTHTMDLSGGAIAAGADVGMGGLCDDFCRFRIQTFICAISFMDARCVRRCAYHLYDVYVYGCEGR